MIVCVIIFPRKNITILKCFFLRRFAGRLSFFSCHFFKQKMIMKAFQEMVEVVEVVEIC